MGLEDEIKKAEKEEMHSQEKYDRMAHEAEAMGKHDMASMMQQMSWDEGRHAAMMRAMMWKDGMVEEKSPERRRAEEVLGRISQPLGVEDRLFPKTYGDWVNLGEAIKDKFGIDDFETTTQVNKHLYNIYEENQNPSAAQESKRWLMQKAAGARIR